MHEGTENNTVAGQRFEHVNWIYDDRRGAARAVIVAADWIREFQRADGGYGMWSASVMLMDDENPQGHGSGYGADCDPFAPMPGANGPGHYGRWHSGHNPDQTFATFTDAILGTVNDPKTYPHPLWADVMADDAIRESMHACDGFCRALKNGPVPTTPPPPPPAPLFEVFHRTTGNAVTVPTEDQVFHVRVAAFLNVDQHGDVVYSVRQVTR
jgi:hypothetical protein